jgi:phosphoribosyl-ATP pyrophosphohydrolase
MNSSTILHQLQDVLKDRKAKRPAGSYTVQLFDGRVQAIGAKIAEESQEFIEAAQDAEQNHSKENTQAVIHEAADLLYHMLVMLAYTDVTLEQVEEELQNRFGISGLK